MAAVPYARCRGLSFVRPRRTRRGSVLPELRPCPADPPRSDERRVATVLFADLVGFTTLSESRDPEQVKNIVDGCFERLVADINAFGGRVDKIIGDAIVALFGAPVAPRGRRRAGRAGRAAHAGDARRRGPTGSKRRHPDAHRREHRRGAGRCAARRRRLHRHGRRGEHRAAAAGRRRRRAACWSARPPTPPPRRRCGTRRSGRSTPGAGRSRSRPGSRSSRSCRPACGPAACRRRSIGRNAERQLLIDGIRLAVNHRRAVPRASSRARAASARAAWPRSCWPRPRCRSARWC